MARSAGKQFRVTKGIVYEMVERDEEVTITIYVQVKGHSLTWYFWAPGAMDQYPQEFRDQLYNAAALAHKSVTRGCDLYYRGSNAVHIKLMHHLETESNHNHYRLINNQHYTPEDFNQHMQALKLSEIHDDFFEVGEIDELCLRFSAFHAEWIKKTGNAPSLEEEYFAQESQRLELDDIIELHMFGQQQEPCRINTAELTMDYEAARKEISEAIAAIKIDDGTVEQCAKAIVVVKALEKRLADVEKEYRDLIVYRKIGGSRGLNSALASSRQIKGSVNPVVKQSVGTDDTLGKEVPDVPEWAKNLLTAVQLSKEKMLGSALQRLDKSVEVDIQFGSLNPDDLVTVTLGFSQVSLDEPVVLVKKTSLVVEVSGSTTGHSSPSQSSGALVSQDSSHSVLPMFSSAMPEYSPTLSSSPASVFETLSVFAPKAKPAVEVYSSTPALGNIEQ